MKMLVAIAGFAAAAFPLTEALAQDLGTVRVRAGMGAQVRPEWKGSDETEWALYPSFGIATGKKPFGFGSPDDGLDLALISSDGLAAGPVFAIEGKRRDSEVGAPVGDVSTTIEAGGFVDYFLNESFRLRAEVRRGIGGHDGWVGQVGGDAIWRDGDKYVLSVGPRLLFSDSTYQRAYFGVTEEAAAASSLEAYRPGSGLHAVAATAGLNYALGGNFGLFGYARYERLVGDAKKSPIVRDLGSPNQYSAGLGLNYTFALRL